MQAFLWWDSPTALEDIAMVKGMGGFPWIKQVFSWHDIEPEKGEFVWEQADQVVAAIESHEMRLIARLDQEPEWARDPNATGDFLTSPPADYADFENFCFVIADRYRGRIQAYQVWNEPNLAREWGGMPPDPADYTRLLSHCYEGIKRADPDALVISAGLAPTGTGLPVAFPDEEFFHGMYDAGASAYYDMLGVNAPGYAAPPEASPDEVAANPAWGGYRWASFRHVEDIRKIMVERGDANKQIAILEMGWTIDQIHPEYSWFAVTERQQAEYLAGAYWWARLNWQPWIGFMTTIYIADPAWTPDDEEYWWAVNDSMQDRQARRAYFWLLALPNWDEGYPLSSP
jgi:hypothetical protein